MLFHMKKRLNCARLLKNILIVIQVELLNSTLFLNDCKWFKIF